MKPYRWLAFCLALALAGVLAVADLSWAQCRGYGGYGYNYGYGPGWQGYGYRGCRAGWQGRGNYGYANYPDYYGAGYRGGYGYCGRGGRRAWRSGYYNYTNTPTPWAQTW